MKQINQAVRDKHGSWSKFETANHLPMRGGKRKIETYFGRLDKWLNTLGLTIKIEKK